ncbi:MAG TPA: FAD-dependent thymidylate synthase, partial [Vicinamibacterales bacterium]|nr:FAD-dependent thymidylate synthase [Vicinamibacterales bacterium]
AGQQRDPAEGACGARFAAAGSASARLAADYMERASVTADQLTSSERRALEPYFTNLDGPVFALVNLAETVKGALFARYSRSPKSLRRLFLDEFLPEVRGGEGAAPPAEGVGERRAEQLYARVFSDYGDDSVAQLGGVHLACEDVSNILTKVLEWGRLMAYLEQSTRYIPYTQQRGGRWRYHVPAELDAAPALRQRFVATLDDAFARYERWIEPMQAHFRERYPKEPADSDPVYRSAIRAKALDTLRGMLPAATQSNVGIYGTGQAYEALLLRMRAHPLAEVRQFADLMLIELRKVIPAFLTRVDQADRGILWSRYLREGREHTVSVARRVTGGAAAADRPEVTLSEFDPEGEIKVAAAALYAASRLPDDQCLAVARAMSADERAELFRAYVGERRNRRHKPGRAFERTRYRFDVLADYGAFRDLQRHRMLTLEWQPLSTRHGYVEPDAIRAAGALDDWQHVMDGSADLYEALAGAGLLDVAPYAVAMAYRVRFYMDMSAREAMHVIELRTAPQGHPSYRRVCQQMHRLIAERAGHRAIADAMRFADHSEVELERLRAERKAEDRRQKAEGRR